MDKKLPSIVKRCKHIYLGMSYVRRINKTICEKAINYTKRDIYTVSLCRKRHNKLEYSYDSAISLYYGSEIYDTMFDKCLNE